VAFCGIVVNEMMMNKVGEITRRHYIESNKNNIDICNICGEKKQMTWDHVPPKATGNNGAIVTNVLTRGLPESNKYQKKYQNGIRFKSLCQECNNSLIGKYDMDYKKFTEDIKNILSTDLILPQYISAKVKINRVCRAICGHFLAAKNFYDDQTTVDKKLREYIFNPNLSGKNITKLYYWVYPYDEIIVIRDVVVCGGNNKVAFPENLISIINSHPLAFMLDTDYEFQCMLDNLMRYTTEDIDEEKVIRINLKSMCYPSTDKYRDFRWPCNLTGNWDGAKSVVVGKCGMDDSRLEMRNVE
jgi:hypothetical protein